MDQAPEVLAAMREWQAVTDDLVAVALSFDAAKLDLPSGCGDWTNRQLLVHIATGYAVRIAALQSVVEGINPPQINADEANAVNIARLADASPEAIVAELRQVRGRVLDLLPRLRSEHLNAATPLGGGKPVREALTGLSAHDLEHLAELRG